MSIVRCIMMRIIKNLIYRTNYLNDLHILRSKFRILRNKTEIEDSWKHEPKNLSNVNFFDWFDSTDSIDNQKKRALIDFKYAISSNIPVDKNKTILEIGFGAGRLGYVACKYSKHYYGIDIHDNFEATANFLSQEGHCNFDLFKSAEKYKVPKFDLAYSFIVIQHFSTINVLEDYLDFLKEKLTNNGCAVLWYAKLQTRFFGDYYEVPIKNFKKRECSLFINKNKMESLIRERGFRILKHKINNRTSDNKRQSTQSFIVFEKNN